MEVSNQFFVDFFTSHVYLGRMSPSGWHSMNCIMCHHMGKRPDNKKKAGVKLSNSSMTYRCFRCKYKAHYRPGIYLNDKMRKLLSEFSISDMDIMSLVVKALEIKDTVEDVFEEDVISFEKFKTIDFPSDTVNIIEQLEENPDKQIIDAAEYALSRNREIFSKTDLFYSKTMKDRFIIPFYYQDMLVGYTARLFKEKDGIKYFTKSSPGYIFNNEHLLCDNKYVLLVEGPMDALSINGCAYMADRPNDMQISWIKTSGKIPVIIPDREESSAPVIQVAIDNGWHVSFPEWDENIKDASDAVKRYGSVWTVENILQNMENTELKIRTRYKLWEKRIC